MEIDWSRYRCNIVYINSVFITGPVSKGNECVKTIIACSELFAKIEKAQRTSRFAFIRRTRNEMLLDNQRKEAQAVRPTQNTDL